MAGSSRRKASAATSVRQCGRSCAGDDDAPQDVRSRESPRRVVMSPARPRSSSSARRTIGSTRRRVQWRQARSRRWRLSSCHSPCRRAPPGRRYRSPSVVLDRASAGMFGSPGEAIGEVRALMSAPALLAHACADTAIRRSPALHPVAPAFRPRRPSSREERTARLEALGIAGNADISVHQTCRCTNGLCSACRSR